MTSSKNFAVREQTLLTRESHADNGTYLDWDTQPSLFKHYPEFCYRLSFANFPQLAWLRSLRCITDYRSVASKPYYRLNVPSAGNLHPIEIYVQIRNITGVLSGIYHVDTLREELVMIEEIGVRGLEPYLGLEQRFEGFLLLFSIVPFRSSWKYGLRAWRYCYLDLGHQIAALHAVANAFELNATNLSDIDTKGLNNVMGMGEDERIAAAFALGEVSDRAVKALMDPLINVPATDYIRRNEQLVQSLAAEGVYAEHCTRQGICWDESINRSRRSARKFSPRIMSDDKLRVFLDTPASGSLEVLYVVMQAQTMQCGVYRNGLCVREGRFVSEMVALLLEQRFIQHAGMIALIFADHFDAKNHIEAGIFAHQLYLLCESLGMGCSGIGAFYDEEASHWSEKPLLYAAAIGGKEDE